MQRISLDKLSQLVTESRKRLGLTQEELGRMTEINRQMISRIEQGKYLPSLPQLNALVSQLNLDLQDLLEEDSSDQVFLAMMGSAETEEEKVGFQRMVSMMLCLRKHEMLRRAYRDEAINS